MGFKQAFAGMDIALLNVLGEAATLDAAAVTVLFEAPWLEPKIGNTETELLEPHAIGLTSALGGAVEGTSVLVHEGSNYKVVANEPDGTGITRLVLQPV